MQYRVNVVNNGVVKKLLSTSIIALMVFASFAIFFVDTVKAAGGSTNDIIVSPSNQHVTIGAVFYTEILVNVSWEINNVTITNVTYENPGYINYTNTSQGELFIGGTWTTPESPDVFPGGGIYNSSGYALPIIWVNTTGVNQTNTAAANITWYANSVGTAFINITGSTYNNVGQNHTTNSTNATVIVHPKGPSSFSAVVHNDTQINLTFNPDTGVDNITVVRNSYMPLTVDDGTIVCNTTATSYEDTNLNSNTTYYYKAWSWNNTASLFCLDSQASPNGTTTWGLLNTTVRGFVNDSEGSPLSSVNISANNYTTGIIDTNVTNATGYYELTLFSGDFNISFNKDGYYPDFCEDFIPENATYWYNATLGSPGGPGGPGGSGPPINDYLSDVTPRYITNGTQQLFNFSLVQDWGWREANLRLNNLTISMSDNLVYAGNNGTTLGDSDEYMANHTSSYVKWMKNNSDGFLFEGNEYTEYFWFVVTTNGPLGTAYLNISAESNESEYSNFSISVYITTNFSFTGSIYDIEGNPLEGATGSMTVQSFTNTGPVTLGTFSNYTDATGAFNITGIPTTQEQQQGEPGPGGPGGSDLFYKLSAAEYRPGTPYAINISASLPSVPYTELSFLLDNPEMYLKKAISFRINCIGPNYNWSNGSLSIDNYTAKTFQVMAKDLRLGYSIQENNTQTYEQIFSVPANRNYSLSIFPDQSFPVSIRLLNITSTCDASGNLSQPGVTIDYMAYNGTYLINVSVNTSYQARFINGSFSGVPEMLDMRVVAYIMEDQDMVFENWALPFNLANETGGADDSYNVGTGEYNISLPATEASSYILLRAYATNASGVYFMDSYMLSAQTSNLSVSSHDFTMTQMIEGSDRSISSNNVTDQWNQTTIVNTTSVLFNLVNSNGSLLSNENPFVDIKRELDGTEYMQMTDGSSGQFNVSLVQGESIKKLTIYSQQYAPVSVPISSSVLSGSTATSTINCTNGVCNITMRGFGEYDPFNQSQDFTMDMFRYNDSCNIPNPPSNYSLTGESMNESSFSPFNAILKGDINMMITSGNLSVYYINVDLLASGPPDATFNENSETSSGGLEAAWQFGSQGPDIYNYVIIGMPYDSKLDNKSIKVKIEKLYDNEFNVIWNSSAGNTTSDIETDSDLEAYIDYINSSYDSYISGTEAYLNGTGVLCREDDPYLQYGLGYKDIANHKIWIKIPHFSGVGPTVIAVHNFTFTGEYPYNNSLNVALTQSTVNVTIQDDEGDTFNWTIWVLGGDSNSSTNDINGSKECNLTTPLSEGTNYTWWVNVTDGNNTANLTYSFTTTYVPYLSGESPVDTSSGHCPVPALYVLCVDNDTSDTMNATWWSNSSEAWVQFGSNETSFANGTNITQTNANFSNPGETYWWSVNVTDGNGAWNNQTYSFNTNYAPTQSGESPTDGLTNISATPALYIICSDTDGDTMTVTWRSDSSGDWVDFATNNNVFSGMNITQTNSNFSSPGETYYWSINVTDGCNWTNTTYSFTTNSLPTQSGESPVDGVTNICSIPSLYVICSDNDGSTLNATWWSNSSEVWVQFGSNETDFASGTNITQTNSNFSSAGTTYYWSVNLTDGGDWTNTTYSFTTNYAPMQSGESPVDGSTGICPIPELYVVCSDNDGSTLNATWWSNSSEVWVQFGSNETDFASGTNITQTNSNFSSAGTTYYWSINVTDGCNWTNTTYSFTTNYAPTLSGESPTDGAENASISPDLYVICSDLDSDTMTATWRSNSSGSWVDFATNNSIGAGTNITQTNSNFTNVSWTYYWSVNLTDGCNWTNVTYSFTTNSLPTQSGESPVDGSTDICPIPELYVVCSDNDGSTLNATWWSNSTNSWVQFGSNETDFASGTNITQTNSNFSSAGTTYYWSVNLTDGGDWTNTTYSFTTNYAPTLSGESPTNESSNSNFYPSCHVVVSDTDGDTLTVYIYENTTGSWVLQQTNASISSGTNVSWGNFTNASSYSMTYNWSVNVTDGCSWTNETYTFTTRSVYLPDPPSSFSASANGRTQIDLLWEKGNKANKTYIEWNTASSWSRGDGTELYNGTGTSTSHTDLSASTTRYYQAWSWNDTGSCWSISYSSTSATTEESSSSPGVPSPIPTADTGGPYEGYVGQTITFNGSGSTASSTTATITDYKWDFDNDGTYNTDYSTSATSTHVYTTAGEYTVKLMVKDDTGATDTDTAQVTINETETTEDNESEITNASHLPKKVIREDNVTIYATVTDDYGVSSVTCYWNDGAEHSKLMTSNDDSTYSVSIGQFSEGITVTYWIIAIDTGSQTTQSETKSFNVVISVSAGNVTSGVRLEITSEELEGTANIDKIEFTSISNLTDVRITIDEFEDKPEDVIEEPKLEDLPVVITDTEKVEGIHIYSYLEINLTAENETVEEGEISSLNIKFKVLLSWLIDNNISKETVLLMRYNDENEEWEQLLTEYLEGMDDDTYAYYNATLTGTSTFAIVGSEISELTGETPKPEGLLWWPIILFIVVAIILLIAFFFKTGYLYIEKENTGQEDKPKKKQTKKKK